MATDNNSGIKLDFLRTESGIRGEPVRMNNWYLVITGRGSVKMSEVPLVCKTVSLPNYSSSPIEIFHGNEKVKIAGAIDVTTVSIEVNDTVDSKTFSECWNWWQLVYNPVSSKVGFAQDYKANGKLLQFSSRGEAVRTWALEGLWPTNFNPGGPLDYSSADPVSMTIELACDRARPTDAPSASAGTLMTGWTMT